MENINLTQKIKSILDNHFEGSQVYVGPMRGASDDHLEIQVTSSQFEGLSLLDQHQMVMDALKEELKDKLHAVRIKTRSEA